MAFELTGVMRYARGARSCPASGVRNSAIKIGSCCHRDRITSAANMTHALFGDNQILVLGQLLEHLLHCLLYQLLALAAVFVQRVLTETAALAVTPGPGIT